MSSPWPVPRRRIAELAGRLRAEGVRAVSANGVLGDPTGAAAATAPAIFGDLVDDLAGAYDAWIGGRR